MWFLLASKYFFLPFALLSSRSLHNLALYPILAHQIGKKLDHLVARMNSRCFRQKEMVKIRRQWLVNDPLITKQLKTILQSSKRKLNNIPSLTKKEIKAKVKLEKRRKIMKTLFDSSVEKNNCSYQLDILEH